MSAIHDRRLIAVMGDQELVTGFLLTGIGSVDSRGKRNYLIVSSSTTVDTIKDFYLDCLKRPDISILLISQPVANVIRKELHDRFEAMSKQQQTTNINNDELMFPVIVEIPGSIIPSLGNTDGEDSKDETVGYDESKDEVMIRVKQRIGGDHCTRK